MYFPQVIYILTLWILNEIYIKKIVTERILHLCLWSRQNNQIENIFPWERERENSTTVMNSRPGAGLVFSAREEWIYVIWCFQKVRRYISERVKAVVPGDKIPFLIFFRVFLIEFFTCYKKPPQTTCYQADKWQS